jgi:hypothetical protein
MGETESSTPRSTAEPQLKAAKDKNCPFCGQAFTSSSLGRHLDLYIRPKNPKAPDGVHNVDEIRKLRGGITRRQAKGSVSTPRRDDSGTSTPANKKQRIASEDSVLVGSPDDDDEPLEIGKTRGQFKDVTWGGGSRPSRLNTKTPDPRRDASRQSRKADLDQRHKTSEENEIASATEMALRELLKSVRDAKYVYTPTKHPDDANQTQCKSIRLRPLRIRPLHAKLPLAVPPDPARALYPLLPYAFSHGRVMVHHPARPEAV